MPQMKPLNWMLLFTFMNLILMFMNIMNYFIIFSNKNNETNFNKKNKFLNWKW